MILKVCGTCKDVKPSTEFYKSSRAKDGLQYHCKLCANAKRRAWAKANPEKNRQWNRNWASKQTADQRYDKKLRSEFKMTLGEYRIMLDEQGGTCAACGSPPGDTRLHVDHDHACCDGKYTCGKCVRGLLCFRCNAALGNVADNIEVLESLKRYLLRSRS